MDDIHSEQVGDRLESIAFHEDAGLQLPPIPELLLNLAETSLYFLEVICLVVILRAKFSERAARAESTLDCRDTRFA